MGGRGVYSWGGGGIFIYSCSVDEFLLKSVVFKFISKRNQLDRTRIYEYTPPPPPPPNYALATALHAETD